MPGIARVYGDYTNMIVSKDTLTLYAVRVTKQNIEIAAIDAVTNTVTSTLTIPNGGLSGFSGQMAISADGSRLFISSHAQEANRHVARIYEVDTSGPSLSLHGQPIDLNQGSDLTYIQSIAISADGTALYAIGDRSYRETDSDYPQSPTPIGTIWIVDLADEASITRVAIPRSMRQELTMSGLAVDADGDRFYVGITPGVVGSGNYYLGTVDTQTRTLDTVLLGRFDGSEVNQHPTFAISHDGTRMYTTTGEIVDLTGAQPHVITGTKLAINQTDPMPPITGLVASQDGTKVYAARLNGGLEVYDAASGAQIGETITLGEQARKLLVSDTGGSLYVLSGVDYIAGKADANSVEDLWKNVRSLPNDANGGVFVQTVRNQSGENRLIIYLGGTVPSYLFTGNQAIGENVPTELGIVKADQVQAISTALAQCRGNGTCGTVSEVMIVGYSQGGIDAQNLASQWTSLGFGVPLGAILTFGSPITSNPDVATVHIQDAQDEVVVPELVARYLIDAAAPLPAWLAQSLTKARKVALGQGQVAVGNASTENFFLDPFRVHGSFATYQELAQRYDEGQFGSFAADPVISRFLAGDVIMPGDPTPTPL